MKSEQFGPIAEGQEKWMQKFAESQVASREREREREE